MKTNDLWNEIRSLNGQTLRTISGYGPAEQQSPGLHQSSISAEYYGYALEKPFHCISQPWFYRFL